MQGQLQDAMNFEEMLGDLAVSVKAEDVEGDLLTGTGEIIDRLQEYLVAVLEGTNVVRSGFRIGGREIFHGTDEGVRAGAVCQIVLNVIVRQQVARRVRVASGEGADECQRLLRVVHDLCFRS